MRLVVAALLVVAPAAAAFADEAWPSLLGTGFLTLPDARTLPRGRLQLAATADNRDRDPLGLDLLDASLAFTVGVGGSAEVYGRAVLSRVVSLPEAPALPPPFLDLVAAPGQRLPPRPHYALHAPTPYVNKLGSARFDAWVRGDAVLGVKRSWGAPAGWRPAVALAGEVTFPLTRDVGDLQSGAGTGATDVGARGIAAWRPGAWRLAFSAGYVRTGRPSLADRSIVIDATGAAGVTELPLVLPARLEVGAAARRRLAPNLAALFEASASFAVGSRTPVVDARWPLDLLAGLQARHGRSRVTAGLRYHAHDAPSGQSRPAPVAGLVDVTRTPAAELEAYLQAIGAGGALASLRPHSQRLLATGSAVPLPAGARVVGPDYTLRSEHQVGFVLLLGWTF